VGSFKLYSFFTPTTQQVKRLALAPTIAFDWYYVKGALHGRTWSQVWEANASLT